MVEEDKKPQTILSFDTFGGKTTAFVPPQNPTAAREHLCRPADRDGAGTAVRSLLRHGEHSAHQADGSAQAVAGFRGSCTAGDALRIVCQYGRAAPRAGFTNDHALLHAAILSKGLAKMSEC